MLQGEGELSNAARGGSTMQCCKGRGNRVMLQGKREPSNAAREEGTE